VAEAWHVLKPGGVFYCLEASEIPVGAVRVHLREMEVTLNHLFSQFMAIAPARIWGRLPSKVFGAPIPEALTLHGRGVEASCPRLYSAAIGWPWPKSEGSSAELQGILAMAAT
jgi:hypothetical protein